MKKRTIKFGFKCRICGARPDAWSKSLNWRDNLTMLFEPHHVRAVHESIHGIESKWWTWKQEQLDQDLPLWKRLLWGIKNASNKRAH